MTLPNMGHAVLINNIAGEQPGSLVDVQYMKDTLETVGFTVHVHENCTDQVRVLESSRIRVLDRTLHVMCRTGDNIGFTVPVHEKDTRGGHRMRRE